MHEKHEVPDLLEISTLLRQLKEHRDSYLYISGPVQNGEARRRCARSTLADHADRLQRRRPKETNMLDRYEEATWPFSRAEEPTKDRIEETSSVLIQDASEVLRVKMPRSPDSASSTSSMG